MKRIFFSITLMLFTTMALIAQDVSISPYSAFGYGEKRFYHGASTYGMGGNSTAYVSPFGNEFNFVNPAANQNLYYTNLVFEGSTNLARFENETDHANRSSSYISRVSLAFPLGEKVRFGFGFQPYTALGYNAVDINSFDEDTETANTYKGDGGINSLHAAISYNVSPHFSVGLRANYLFGNLDKEEVLITSSSQLYTSYKNNNRIRGTIFTGGVTYSKANEEKKRITVGAYYGLGTKVKSDQEYLVSTYQLNPLNNYEPINIDTIAIRKGDTKVKMPQNASIGISYGKDLKWNIGAQFDWEQTSEFSLPNQENDLKDRFRTSVGGYIIPQFNSYKSYFARATYRAGLFYEKTPTVVKGEDINKYGITFGVGLPVGKINDPSEINLGVEMGRRGKLENGLIKENYANIKLSFTLNDRWFQRRTYD